jgi:hypothetical protein
MAALDVVCRDLPENNDSPRRESAPILGYLCCSGAHLDFREARKGPGKRAIRFESENNSLSCRLNGGESGIL